MISIPHVSRPSLPSSSPDHTLPVSRSNNLNAIRLALAGMVMFSHSFDLSYGSAASEPLRVLTRGQETCGAIAVDLFFLISGMLITASWFRSKSMNDFLMRRVLRIYPGFLVALSFSALLTWTLCPEFRLHVGHGLSWTRDFMSDAAGLNQASLLWTGTFARNPFPGVANGSLWTIRWEFGCYLLVAVIGLFCLFKRRWLILIMAGLAVVAFAWGRFHGVISEALPSHFFSYFFAGMITWLFRDKIRFSWLLALICSVVLLVATRITPAFSLLFPIAGSYIALRIGLSRSWRLTRWTEKTDISYGVYLYAFPVQQVVAMFPEMRSVSANLLISLPVTVIMAFASWYLVENRFLRMKSARLVDYDPAISQ